VKLGPFNITTSKPKTQEIGVTGTQIFADRIGSTDYNFELEPPNCYAVYDKMRKGDGGIAAILRVLKQPLLNADWSIEPASESATDKMIAEVIREDMFEALNVSFGSWLSQSLLHLDYGAMVFEKVWRIDESGLVRLRKLAPRLPASITEWNVDTNGGLAGIKQQAPPNYKPVEIPVDKLLVFTNELEGSDYRGTSVLRPAYKHWKYIDGLERIAAIAMEKRALGVDKGILKGDAINTTRQREMETALMGLHAHEKQFIVVAEGQTDYELVTGGQGLPDALPLIQHHFLMCLRSVVVEFVGMGAGSTGSLAMSRDKTSWVLLCLGGIGDYISDTVSRHLFQPWVDYNWNGAKAPRLVYSRLEQRDVAVFADAVQKLTASGALTADETLETDTRDLLSLPKREGPRAEPPGLFVDESGNNSDAEMSSEELAMTVTALRRELKQRRDAPKTEALP